MSCPQHFKNPVRSPETSAKQVFCEHMDLWDGRQKSQTKTNKVEIHNEELRRIHTLIPMRLLALVSVASTRGWLEMRFQVFCETMFLAN